VKGFLLKLGKPKHILDMYEQEYMFFNNLRNFRAAIKDESGRLDPREANTLNVQINYLEISTSKGTTIKLSEISKEFNAQYNEHPTSMPHNICSLFTLELDKEWKFKTIDSRILKLGEYTLIIYNLKEFFRALDDSISALNYQFLRKPVIYYNHRTFEGKLTPCHKDEEFSYQNEYRILINTPGIQTLNIPIPGLRKFSTIVKTEQLNSLKIDEEKIL
jgi:hypothetical protein